MLDSAKTDMDTPAFLYSKKMSAKGTFKRVGILMLDESQYKEISTKEASSISPRHLPMLIPPKLWDNKNLRDGCYFRLRASIMRTVSNAQTDALRRANMDGVLEGLDYLGKRTEREQEKKRTDNKNQGFSNYFYEFHLYAYLSTIDS